MSNQVSRPLLLGLLKQQGKTVGRIELPQDAWGFIERFNQEYAPIGLSIVPAGSSPAHPPSGQPTPADSPPQRTAGPELDQ